MFTLRTYANVFTFVFIVYGTYVSCACYDKNARIEKQKVSNVATAGKPGP